MDGALRINFILVAGCIYLLPTQLRRERGDVVLDDLLDLGLELRRHGTSSDLGEESSLGLEVLAELSFPDGDLVDGDGIELKRKVRR